MPNNQFAPNPVAGSGAREENLISSSDYNRYPQVKRLQEEVLRGLLHCSAEQVLDRADRLTEADFPDAPHRAIMRGITHVAQTLVDAGEAAQPVSIAVVRIILREQANHTRDLIETTVQTITTGYPASWYQLDLLCDELRLETLKRAAEDHAEGLIAAVNCPTEHLAQALRRLGDLNELARRAGLVELEVMA